MAKQQSLPAIPKKKRAPKVQWDAALEAKICAYLEQGESVVWVSKQPGMPGTASIYKRLGANGAFLAAYQIAKRRGLDRWAEDIVQIADEKPPRVEGRVDPGFVTHQRNRIEARKWVMSKLDPMKYGDKVETTLGGSVKIEGIEIVAVGAKAPA